MFVRFISLILLNEGMIIGFCKIDGDESYLIRLEIEIYPIMMLYKSYCKSPKKCSI